MVNPNQGDCYKEMIPQNMCINEDLPYKEMPFMLRNGCQPYTIIKTPKPSHTKVHIIYPNSGTLEL